MNVCNIIAATYQIIMKKRFISATMSFDGNCKTNFGPDIRIRILRTEGLLTSWRHSG